MNTKMIALCVAATFSASAFAETGNIVWYGKANLNVESVKNDKRIAPNKDSALRVLSNASTLGIKGSEDLGNNMSGLYQYEVEADGNGASATVSKGFGVDTRNSGIGIEGNFGKVIIGKWDTPFKVAHDKIELFENASSFTATNLVGRAGGTAADYNTRQSSVIEYWLPQMGAIKGAISYSPDAAPTTTQNRSRLSLAGTFEQGPIAATAAYENRSDATTAGKTDSGLRLVGKYTMGDMWFGATIERLTVEALTSYTQSNIELAGQYTMGANKFAASYAKAGKTNAASSGANQLTLRYGHDYSKRTEVYAALAMLKNDTAGTYSLTQVFGPALGSKQTVLGAGISHSF